MKFDYRLRQSEEGWRIIDVTLDGKVSEITMRRADYGSVIKREGFPRLVDSIEKNTDPPVPAADAKATLAAAIAGRTSIQTGTPVAIENSTNEPSPEGMTEDEIPVSRSST